METKQYFMFLPSSSLRLLYRGGKPSKNFRLCKTYAIKLLLKGKVQKKIQNYVILCEIMRYYVILCDNMGNR